ncbi:MAG: hypothetical protein IJZ47_10325 [Oscillospiraceae bacterium]|nr:hypothetical protein [Oscillospiraceae bacterium]
MNITELKIRLFNEEVPHYMYSVGDGEEEQRVCLRESGGKWLVYYCEDGEKLELMEFSSESEACEELYKRVSG